MNVRDVASLRRLFAGSPFDDEVVEFSSALGHAPRSAGELLLVGTDDVPYLDVAQHVVSATAPAGQASRRSVWARLARMLERSQA